jgi:hypothetical protein
MMLPPKCLRLRLGMLLLMVLAVSPTTTAQTSTVIAHRYALDLYVPLGAIAIA